jgi:hypothetical protein
LFGVHDEARVDVHGLELPGAALPDEFVLVDRLAPQCAFAGLPGHTQIGAARAGGSSVGRHGDDRLQVDVIVNLAFGKAHRP